MPSLPTASQTASLLILLLVCSCDFHESVSEVSRSSGVRPRDPAVPTATPNPEPEKPQPSPSAARPAPPPATTATIEAGCPADMVAIGRFCIDRHEAHLRRVTPTGPGAIHPHFERPAPNETYVAVSAPGVFPQGYISRNESQAACEQAGKRLCSRGEWLLGCRGTNPTPDRRTGVRPCNNGKAHLLTQLFGWGYDYEAHFNSPELNQTPGFLAKTGAHPACVSAGGVHDMVGNLHEWVSGTVTQRFLAEMDAEGVQRAYQHIQIGNGIFMGGFYSTTGELGSGCMFTTVAHDAGYHDYTTGFRCCRDRQGPQAPGGRATEPAR